MVVSSVYNEADKVFVPWGSNKCLHLPEPGLSSPFGFCFFAGPASYQTARDHCQSLGGDLASIHNDQENAQAYALTNGQSTRFGLNDRSTEERYVWSDGSAVGYIKWGGGEPNNYGGDEDCVAFLSGGGDGWADIKCDITSDRTDLGYLCKVVSQQGDVCVCVCVCERERERVCVCVYLCDCVLVHTAHTTATGRVLSQI